jgi:tRNA(Ile)-lysidine synthase
VTARVAQALRAHVAAGARVVVGLSGGVDSVLLLDALADVAEAAGIRLEALHVHHGLLPDADRWAAFCAALGARRNVPVRVERVRVDLGAGLGIEAAARAARYAAYRASGADVVALAHHRDDQAETLLLQLVRGAGVAGLAAMPAWQPGSPALLRPLLHLDRADIEAEARARGLDWVHDPSNDDPRFARSTLRREVLPVLRRLNPAAAANVARSAGHLAEAHAVLAEVGRADLAACAAGNRLRIDALLALGDARARNAIRTRLQQDGVVPPSARRMDALLAQLRSARADGAVRVALDAVEARRYRNELWLVPVGERPPDAPFSAVWGGEAAWRLPALGGTLAFEPALGEGLDAARAAPGAVEVRARRGGERLRVAPGRPHRTLKNLFQESAVPPWERAHVPLVYVDGRLACVPGVGVDPDLAAAAGRPGLRLCWKPESAAKSVIK